MRHCRRFSLLAVLGCAACLLPAPGLADGAAPKALPLTIEPLGAGRLELDLHDSRVDIVIDPDAPTSFEASSQLDGEDDSVLLVSEDAKSVQIAYPYQQEGVDYGLRVRVVLNPSQQLSIKGKKVDVTVIDHREELSDEVWSRLEEAVAEDRGQAMAPGGTARQYAFALTDSALVLENLTGATIEGAGNHVGLSSCQGPVVFDVADAEVDISDHWGSLYLRGLESTFSVDVADANVDLGLEDCDLILGNGRGRVSGLLFGGLVSISAWSGQISLDGTEADIEARDLPAKDAWLTVSGKGNRVTAENLAGAVNVNLQGGRLEASAVAGRASVTGREGTEVDLRRIGDSVTLELSEGSVGLLEEVGGSLTARITSSELDASTFEDLDLTARDAVVYLKKAKGRFRASAIQTMLDAEYTERGSPELSVSGESEVRLGVLSPCRVQVGGAAEDETIAGVAGGPCEVLGSTSRRRAFGTRGGPRPVTIKLEIESPAEFEAWSW